MTTETETQATVEDPATQKKESAEFGLVLYTDGGCRPNPGNGGWGMHGYLYSTESPKRGAGNQDHVLTARGYMLKSDVQSLAITGKGKKVSSVPEITPVHYVDGYGSFAAMVTNNIAEVVAATQAFRYALEHEVTKLLIRTDSEHVIKGLSEWVPIWTANDWRKRDGTPPANVNYWRDLVAARDAAVAKGIDYEIKYVRAHDGEPGNEKADDLATLGTVASRTNSAVTSIITHPSEGYWKYTPEKHPFILNRRMYFNTQADYNHPGHYYLGEHGKDDDMLGKRMSDGRFSVVRLAKPEPVLELVRNDMISRASALDSIVMVRLDTLFRPNTHKELSTHGRLGMVYGDGKLAANTLDGQPLAHELRPPRIAMRAVEALSALSDKLDRFLENDPSIVVTDLTSILYETTVKASKKGEVRETKLKPQFIVGYSVLKLDANYQVEQGVEKAEVNLTLGIDLLDRNALKRLEETEPKVFLITWLEAPRVFRYATVVKSDENVGIWAGVYSNMRLVSE